MKIIMLMLQRFDMYILSIINKYLKNKYMDTFMCIMTKLGDMGAIWIAIAFILLLDEPYRYMGKMIIITLVVSTVLGEGVLKHLIKRLRPCNEKKDVELIIKRPVSSYSFPSGHTLSSFAVAGVLSTYFIQYGMIFIVLASFIALSRIYLYVHYPTDIVGGIIIGLMCSKFIFMFCN